jgi:4-hydroxy-tetrahydrodipicolinate reductase
VRHYPAVEIVEEHSHTKKDAPSGTAADTAWQLAAAKGGEARDIPIHSVRIPGLYSNQTVVFGGTGEVLRLTHETYGVAAFGPGILAGLTYASVASGVARGVGLAFEHARASRT